MNATQLRSLVCYDPVTGRMTWRVKLSAKQYVGDDVGHVGDKGYRCTKIKRKSYKVHCLIWLYMTGEWPEHEVDHEDRDRANNRWANLRPATHKQNAENRTPRHDSSSGVTGVVWNTREQAWRATICIDGRKRQVGSRKSLIDAVALRIGASREHHTHSQYAGGA
jgi:HNH endonuclease